MALLDRVKVRTGSDLPDAELQAMIDGIMAELAARFGPAGQEAVLIGDLTDPNSRHRRTLRLPRPADLAQAISVAEIDPGNTGSAADRTVLTANDFAVMHGGRTLQRLTGGDNGRDFWAPLVEVTFTPLGEAAARDEATIKLMLIDLSYRGLLKSERAGDYQFTLSGDAQADREQIFEGLATRRGMVMA